MPDSIQLFHSPVWARTASVSLPSLCDDQGRQVSAACNFELYNHLIFLDLDSTGIFSSGCEQKVLDVLNFSRHNHRASRRVADMGAVRREGRKERDSHLPAANPSPRGNWVPLRIYFEYDYVLQSGTVITVDAKKSDIWTVGPSFS